MNRSKAPNSKVGTFQELEWGVVWTLPYCPEFKSTGHRWGAAKHRALEGYYPGHDMATIWPRLHMGFYGGTGTGKN